MKEERKVVNEQGMKERKNDQWIKIMSEMSEVKTNRIKGLMDNKILR